MGIAEITEVEKKFSLAVHDDIRPIYFPNYDIRVIAEVLNAREIDQVINETNNRLRTDQSQVATAELNELAALRDRIDDARDTLDHMQRVIEL